MGVVPENRTPLIHAMTVDVEDWYHDAFANRPSWGEARVEQNTSDLLDLFADTDTKATLFFLGEVAREHPGLIRRAVAEGHEVASHGFSHRSVGDLTREEFRRDVLDSIATIEDAVGQRVRGYRAPYFSIKADVHCPLRFFRTADSTTMRVSWRLIARPDSNWSAPAHLTGIPADCSNFLSQFSRWALFGIFPCGVELE